MHSVNIKLETSESVRHDTHCMVLQYIQKHNDICILQCCLYSWEHRYRSLHKGKSWPHNGSVKTKVPYYCYFNKGILWIDWLIDFLNCTCFIFSDWIRSEASRPANIKFLEQTNSQGLITEGNALPLLWYVQMVRRSGFPGWGRSSITELLWNLPTGGLKRKWGLLLCPMRREK